MRRARTAFPLLLSLLVLSFLFLFLPVSLSQQPGSTLYVNNSDATCTGRWPCYKTIQAAVNAAQPGDSIHVQAGTYRERLSIQGKNNFAGVRESDRIIIEADPLSPPGSVVITNGSQRCADGDTIQIKRSWFITIRGLIITGSGGSAISLVGGGINHNQAIHIERNRIFGNGNSDCNGGITVVQENSGTLIVNNLIYGNGGNGISLIGAREGSYHIVNNTIHANQWNGVSIVQGQEIYLINNIITQNGVAAGSTGGRFGLQREKSSKSLPQVTYLLNNLICGNRLGEIDGPALDSTDSSNLTPKGTEGAGVSASPSCQVPANVYAHVNGVDGLPNTADDDFTLASHSPAIDRGMDPRTLGLNVLFNAIFEADFSIEAARPSDGNADRFLVFDIGAFEFPNNHPIANAGPDQTVFRGTLVTLDGTQSHDPEGATLRFQWTLLSQPQGSAVALNDTTSATPQFNPLILGSYVFQLVVNDGESKSAPDTVRVNVVNRAPTASSATITSNEDTPVIITLSASDLDSTSLSFTVVSDPSKGSLSTVSPSSCVIQGQGSSCSATATYTPAANYNGADSFTFKVNDGTVDSNIATVSITINAVNDAPVARSVTASTAEETTVIITLSASDIDSPSLTFTVTGGARHGFLGSASAASCTSLPNGTGTPGSSCTATVMYEPAANYNGADSFTYKTNDGSQDSNVATVSITVTPVNDPPVANEQSVATDEDTTATITLSASDIDSPSLSFTVVSGPSNGSLGAISTPNCVVNGAGSFCTAAVTYTPASNYNGYVSFTFKVNDGSVDSNAAMVSITVNTVNDTPVATNDFYDTDEDTPLHMGAPGVLGNDIDVDDAQSTLTAVLVSGPANAVSFMLNSDGSFSYTPAANFNGADAFTYRAQDPHGAQSNLATVTITINPVNDAPVATNDFYNTDEEVTLNVFAPGVLANDNDIDTPVSSLTAILVTAPSRAATFTLNSDGSFSYAPAANFNGADTFTYKTNDGVNDSNVAMVTITVNPVNDVPVAQNDTYTTAEETTLAVDAPGVLSNDSDVDGGETLTAELVSGPTHAADFQLNADGSYSYTPAQDFNGVETFTYRVFDGTLYSNVAMVQITITAVNDAPVASSTAASTNEETPVSIILSASDVDSTILSFTVVTSPSHGSLSVFSPSSCTINGQGSSCTASVTYTPAANYKGPDSFGFKVSDGQAASNTATASITVNHVNHAPTANANGPYSGRVRDPIQFTGSGSDPDGDPITFAWDFGDGGAASGQNPTHTYPNAGIFTITLTVADPFAGIAISQTTATVAIGLEITALSPASGAVGTDVTIQGKGFDPNPGKTSVRFNGVQAITTSVTETTIRTFVPLSATTGRITAETAQGTTTSNDDFVVLLRQDFTLSVSPGVGVAVQGTSTTYAVQIISTGPEAFAGLATLSVSGLPAGVTAGFTPSTMGSNSTGLLTLTTTTFTPVASSTIEVQAATQLEGRSITRTALITLGVQAPGQTVLVGQIRDGQDQPLAVVSIKQGGITISDLGVTDGAGNFFIPLSVSGSQVFLIDGSTANTPTVTYSTVAITLDIQPGVINTLGFTPHLAAQPSSKLVPIIPGQETVLTDPEIPGFKMVIPAGVRIIGWDGQPNNQFSVTVIPIDRSPLPPLPSGLNARQIYLFNFGKIGGGVPTGNVPIDTPNDVDGLPGDKIDLYYFNEAPDGTAPNRWEKYGAGTVSSDGTRIITDINPSTGLPYGIPRFCCGGRVNVPPPQVRAGGGPSGGPSDCCQLEGEPVDTVTGFFYLEKTDLVLPGILPIAITRTYRNELTNTGPFGLGTSWPYDIFLQPPPNGSTNSLILYTPGNRQDLFARQLDGSFINSTSPAQRGAVVTVAGGLRSVRFKDGSLWSFDGAGRLIGQMDPNGNTITITRDGQGRVTRITEPSGRQFIMSFTGFNLRIDRIQDPIGRQVLYNYDASGRLSTVTDTAGGTTRYTYDSSHRMVSITDPRGITLLTNEYDSAGRVIRQTHADGGVWTFAYTTTGSFISQTTVTNPRENKTTYRFNSAGYRISQTDALGQATNLQRQTGTNLILSTTDPLGRVTRLTYDANGNVTRITDPAGNERTFTYEPIFNKLTSITGPLAQITVSEYDARGNLTATVDPTGARTSIAYNSFGQPVSTTDPLGNTTRFNYDSFGNLVTITDPLNNTTQRTYDLISRLIDQTDPRGRSTRLSYDGLNRITQIVDALNGFTSFSYDGNGNLLTVIDARRNTTSYTYDSMDRLATRSGPVGAIELFGYDTAGNLLRHTDRKGQINIFSYDALNRRTHGNYADGTTTSFVYDAVGRPIEASDSVGGTILNAYDILGRLIAQTTEVGTVSYQYDAVGRRTLMDVSGEPSVTYTYDPASRLRQMVQGSQTVDLTYDALGRRTRLTLPNGVSTEYQYDVASHLTELTYRNVLGVLGNLTYGYDAAGNRIAVGGSFARTLLPDTTMSATYDVANRQLAFGDKTMTYDVNGNLTSISDTSGLTTLAWDARNRLFGLSGPSTTASFTYDVLGRRVMKEINGQQVQYQYDGVNPVQETSGATVIANILTGLGIDEHLARTDVPAATTSYFLLDALGSALALADSAGAVQTEYTYEPFGRPTATGAGSANPFQYTGREDDGTGLYHYRARYYHSGMQRFVSEDPTGFAGGDMNFYAYVYNNPLKLTDPLGLDGYMCTKPLHALGKFGEWVYGNNVPLLYHQYICVKNGQTTVCGGQDRAGGPYSGGIPSNDQFDDGKCEKKDDRPCMDRCLTQAVKNPIRPPYGVIGPRTNCQEWADDIYSKCMWLCQGS